MVELKIRTKKREEVIDITEHIASIVNKAKVKEGICCLYLPHATAALAVNERADPNIGLDFLEALNKLIPQGIWRHDEIDRNGAAHLKAAVVGPDLIVPIKNSALSLGTWQGIMLCEFDGPRERRVIVKTLRCQAKA